MAMSEELSPGPLFAVGIWRSGTSLLYALLNQHPRIALLYEGDLPLLHSFFWPGIRSNWCRRWDFWNTGMRRHQLEQISLPSAPINCVKATEQVYRQYAAAKQACIWGDKSPTYFDKLLALHRQFPNARFLIIWRSPLGFCRSIVRAAPGDDYFRRRGTLERVLLGYRQMKLQADELIRRGVPLHQVHYEELTTEPEAVLKGICNFLGVSFEPRMLSLKDADRSAIMDGQHHSKVKSDQIVSASDAQEVLPPEWKGKIERYIRLWKTQSGDSWPVYPVRIAEGPLPSFLELLRDKVLFRLFRWFDALVLIIYSVAPISILHNYRERKRQREMETQASSP
jgi:hypothetical protein